jgi:ribosomal protein S18 acetylase RimI-like enzyme
MPGEVTVRTVRMPADGEFLLAVYASTRTDLSMLDLPEAQAEALIRMQFDAQTRHYGAVFPAAGYSVVAVDGEPAGRLIVDRTDAAILIVDLALLPRFRRAGVGTELVRRLLDEADLSALPVRCHVVQDNEARAFWERLGFVAGELGGVHLAMERRCDPRR